MVKTTNYPIKETINLAMKEKSEFSPGKMIPALVLILAVAFAFSYFAVIKPFEMINNLNMQSINLSNQIADYEAATANYDEVLEEYTNKSNNWMTDEELSLIDYRFYYSMMDSCVLPYSDITSVSLQGNKMTLNLANLSLQDAASIISSLTMREDVVDVSINTANRNAQALTAEKTGQAVMVVILTNGWEPTASAAMNPALPQ